MSRGICPRVNSFDSVRILALVIFAVNAIEADKHTCYEVRAAFQQRYIGPLHLVPEKPYKDADLQICKHQGPSCCTKKMEECYQAAVKRETLQKIESYTYELENMLSSQLDTFQDVLTDRVIALETDAWTQDDISLHHELILKLGRISGIYPYTSYLIILGGGGMCL